MRSAAACSTSRRAALTDAKGREVPITAMEFDLLKALIEHPNQVLSRDQLLTLTRNRDWEPFDRSIDIRITRLRRKVEEDPGAPPCHPHRARRRLHVRPFRIVSIVSVV